MKNLIKHFRLLLLLTIFSCARKSENIHMKMASEEESVKKVIIRVLSENVDNLLFGLGLIIGLLVYNKKNSTSGPKK